MRRKFTFLLCLLTLLFICLPLYAHPGRTDLDGGHEDTQNTSGLGSYHYHCDGHPAHLHEGGICPYQNVVTESKSNSFVFSQDSTGVSTSKATTPSMQTKTHIAESEANKKLFFYLIVSSICAVFLLIVAFVQKHSLRQKDALIERLKSDLIFVEDKFKYYRLYHGKSLRDLVPDMPDNVFLDNKGLPTTGESFNLHWGEYTAYVTFAGKHFHADKNCYRMTKQINIFDALSEGYRPCQKCAGHLPGEIPEWYIECRKIYYIKKKYHID